MSTTAPQTWHAVTALIVAHDGSQLLPGLVRALAAQTYRVSQVVGADTGSRDDSGAVLAGLIGEDSVVTLRRSAGFGEAIAAGLRHAALLDGPAASASGVPRVEWIWLLHDDCEPAPDALERLLQAAGRDRSTVVLGPKVRDGQDRRTLREVGVSIDRAGRRVTGIDPGEIDQGQHDHKSAVLAVSSAGMLVRRDVWDRLGGFDPNLRMFRDDIDFCWRVQAAGLRVQVVTDAVLYHRELAARRRRPVTVDGMRRLDRRNALFVLAVNLPLLTMLRVVGGCIIGSLARAFYFLLTKQLDLAAAYALSVLSLLAHPVTLIRGRRKRAAGIARGHYAVWVFIPPARTLSRLAERIAGLVSNGPPQASHGRHQAAEESEEDAQFVDQPSVVRRVIGQPGVQLFAALLLITLVAERRLLSATPLGGGALVPAWGGAAALWHEYLAGFHAVGVGSTASAPPYLAVVATLATLLGGQAWLAVDVLLLGCVPLAGLTAYLATRWVTSARTARVLLAACYALLPVATGAVAAGRLGTAVAFTLLPLIGVSAGRMVTAAPRQAGRAAWSAGLLIAVASAFAPFTWVLGVVFAVGALAARRWLVAVSPVNAAIVALTPFLVLFPWSLSLLGHPSRFLAEAGLAMPGLTTHGLSAGALLALSPGGPGVPPVWVTAGLALALLALVLPAGRSGLVLGGWAVAVAGLLAAVLVSRVSLPPAGGGQASAAWPGVATALAALGLLTAFAPAAGWLTTIITNGGVVPPAGHGSPARGPARSRLRRLLALLTLAATASAPVLVAGYWLGAGVRGPVNTISAPLLPAFVSASATSGEQERTLILRPAGSTLDYQVVRQADPTLGQPELSVAADASAALSRQVAALGAPDGADAGDPGRVLGSFGIGWVMLPGPVDAVLAQRLDASLGLVAQNKGTAYDLWKVTGPVGRVRVVAANGATTVVPSGAMAASGAPAPAAGGTLILAEPYGGWTATLNGQALKPVAKPVDGWAQGFVLPAGGGQLSITRDDTARTVALFLELAALLAVCLLALPGKRADPVAEAEALAALREARDAKSAASAARRAARGGRTAVTRRGVDALGAAHAVGGADLLGLGRARRALRARADSDLAGHAAEESVPDVRVPDERVSDERVPDERVSDERVPDEWPPDERLPNVRVPGERPPDERVPDEWPPRERMPDEWLPGKRMPVGGLPDATGPSPAADAWAADDAWASDGHWTEDGARTAGGPAPAAQPAPWDDSQPATGTAPSAEQGSATDDVPWDMPVIAGDAAPAEYLTAPGRMPWTDQASADEAPRADQAPWGDEAPWDERAPWAERTAAGQAPALAPWDDRAADAPQAPRERHSHRAAKHGKPGRWRGTGNRSARGGRS